MRFLLLAENFPANPTGYWMEEAELRAWAEERVIDHLRRLGGGALDLSVDSIAQAVRKRGWVLLVDVSVVADQFSLLQQIAARGRLWSGE